MLNSCCSRTCVLLFALFCLVDIISARPYKLSLHSNNLDKVLDLRSEELIQKNFTKRSSRSSKPVTFEDHKNKTKTRILTHPKRDFFGNEYSEQDIIFPDSFEILSEPIPRIDGPPKCADGSTFCENFERYPYNHLKDILKKNEVPKDLFGLDEVPTEITNRIGEEEGEMFVCASVSRTIFPKIGKNKNSKWKYIINQGDEDGFVQGVRIETCRNQGSACDIIGELPNGYTTMCKQKYVYRRMLSISDNGRPIPDTFQLPSACCCAYKRDVDFLSRFGTGRSTSPAKKER